MAEYDVRIESKKIDTVRVSSSLTIQYIDKNSCSLLADESGTIDLYKEEIANLIKALEKVQELQADIVPK